MTLQRRRRRDRGAPFKERPPADGFGGLVQSSAESAGRIGGRAARGRRHGPPCNADGGQHPGAAGRQRRFPGPLVAQQRRRIAGHDAGSLLRQPVAQSLTERRSPCPGRQITRQRPLTSGRDDAVTVGRTPRRRRRPRFQHQAPQR